MSNTEDSGRFEVPAPGAVRQALGTDLGDAKFLVQLRRVRMALEAGQDSSAPAEERIEALTLAVEALLAMKLESARLYGARDSFVNEGRLPGLM